RIASVAADSRSVANPHSPAPDLSWSDRLPEATKLETLLNHLSPKALLDFRARFGRACLDPAPGETRTLRRVESSGSRGVGRQVGAAERKPPPSRPPPREQKK